MAQSPQEGESGRNDSTLELRLTSLEVRRQTWADGQVTLAIVMTTKHGRYKVSFAKTEFLDFTVKCLEALRDTIRAERAGK